MKRPRDYRAHGATYDSLVVGIIGHYLALLEAAQLVDGDEIDEERAVLEAILEDRKAGVHRLVTWRSIDRDVCTCALVLPRDQAFVETTGHVDPTSFQLAGTILVQQKDRRDGLCLHCTATYRDDSFDKLRQWQQVHMCPPDEPETEPSVDPVDLRIHRTQAAYFRAVIVGQQRRMHPRSGG